MGNLCLSRKHHPSIMDVLSDGDAFVDEVLAALTAMAADGTASHAIRPSISRPALTDP